MESPQRPPLISLWDFAALVGFGVLWVVYLQTVSTLPDLVPTHFDALGHPNGWTPKAALPWVIFGLPLFIWGTTTAVAIFSSRAAEDPAKARALAMAPMRGGLGLGLCALMAALLLAPTRGTGVIFAGLGVLLAFLALGIGMMIRDMKHVTPNVTGRQFYKWGLFYVNPDDPKIWIEKPVGVGWTLNFARPASWFFLVLMPALLAVMLVKAGR